MKKIKLTEEDKIKALENFRNTMNQMRFEDSKITYTLEITPEKDVGKAAIYFTPEAYCKMLTLVQSCSKEIAWHGVVEKQEDFVYIIHDILVYPQEIAGMTVTSNDAKYPMWLMEQPDEIFNNLRLQGHSHVNMTASPSGVDTTLYSTTLSQLDEEDYYIFMIMNKRLETWFQIYDLKENILFEKNDIDMAILFEDGDSSDADWFIENVDKNIIETKPVYDFSQYGLKTNVNTTQSGANIKEQIKALEEEYTIDKKEKPKIKIETGWILDKRLNTYVPAAASEKQIRKAVEKAKRTGKTRETFNKSLARELSKLKEDLDNMMELEGMDKRLKEMSDKEIKEEIESFIAEGSMD